MTVSWPAEPYWVPSAAWLCCTGCPVPFCSALPGPQSIPSPIMPCHTRCPVPSGRAILGAQSCLAVPHWAPSPTRPCRTGRPAVHSHTGLPSTGHLVPSVQLLVPSTGCRGTQYAMPSSPPGTPSTHRLAPSARSGTASALCLVRGNSGNWFPVWATQFLAWATQCAAHPWVSGTRHGAPSKWLPVTGTEFPVARLGCPVPALAAGCSAAGAVFPVQGDRCGTPSSRSGTPSSQ